LLIAFSFPSFVDFTFREQSKIIRIGYSSTPFPPQLNYNQKKKKILLFARKENIFEEKSFLFL